MGEVDRVTALTERVAQQFREKAGALEVSRSEIARRTGLTQTLTNNVFRGTRSPTLEQMALICAELGLNPAEVLRKAQTPTHS